MYLSNRAAAVYFVLFVFGNSSAIFVSTETTFTSESTESISQTTTGARVLKSLDSSMENDVVLDVVAKESLNLVMSTTLVYNGSSQEATLPSATFDTINLETGSGGYERETITDVHEQLEQESLIITTDSGRTVEKHSRTIEPSELVTTSTTDTTILVTSTTHIDQLNVIQTDSIDTPLVGENIVLDTIDNSSRTHSEPVSQSHTETFTTEYPSTTIEQNLETLQVTPLVEESTMSDVDHPTTSTQSLMTTLEERQTSSEGTGIALFTSEDINATSESTTVSDTIGFQTTANRDRSLQLEDEDHLTTEFNNADTSTHATDIDVQEKAESQDLTTMSDRSATETTDSSATSATSDPTQVESASTLTTGQMSQLDVTVTTEQTSDPTSVSVTTEQTSDPTSVSVTTEQISHKESVSVTTEQISQQERVSVTSEQTSYSTTASGTTEQTSHEPSAVITTDETSRSPSAIVIAEQASPSPSVTDSDSISYSETSDTTSMSVEAVPTSTQHIPEISTSTGEFQTTQPVSTNTVSLINNTTVTTITNTSPHVTEKEITLMTTEIVSDSTSETSTIVNDKITIETNRINCTPSEDSSSTTTTVGDNLELPIMKNVKSYDDLSEPEFFNSVTVIFKKPEFGTKDSMYFNQDVFKKVVVCLLNVYEAEEWSSEGVNVTSCNFKEDDSNIEDFIPLKPNDLVIVYPSPKDNQDEEIVSFFVKNNTVEGQIVSRNRTLIAIGQQQHLLSEQMGMEVVEVYGRIPVALLVASKEKAFHVRHSMLLIILLAVVSSCILAIMTALFCMKCKTQRGRWAREIHDKTQLQSEANKRPDMGDHLNSDEDIRKDESIRAFKNGNGYHGTENGSESTVINITDTNDAWVVPYNQLTADEKAVPETLDTKL